MKCVRVIGMGMLALAMGIPAVQAQFLSGSDGSDGALTVLLGETITLDLPVDGTFHFTTITVEAGGILLFNKNVLNTPAYLLATGDILVNGTINIAGLSGNNVTGGVGGPGGFEGGAPGIAGGDPGDGHGPGAGAGGGLGTGGNAAYGADPAFTNRTTDGVVYGSPLLVPLVGGSGGGGEPDGGGGGGGGAILLASSTQVLFAGGTIHARGAAGSSNRRHGSGGGIRIVAPLVGGSGVLDVVGGGNGFGGAGRIRVDLIDRSQLTLTASPTTALSVGGFMAVFPDVVTRLDVTNVAGNDIPVGTPGPVQYVLPFNSPTMQPVTVEGLGFSGVVPISIVLTPDAGPRRIFDAEIDMSVVPPEVTVTVDFPANVATRVHAWTR